MAQTIAQSLEILNETMDNSKTALQVKGVTVEDTYKLSDVDEKIGEIEVSSGSAEKDFTFIKDLNHNGFPLQWKNPHTDTNTSSIDYGGGGNHGFTFTVAKNCKVYAFSSEDIEFTIDEVPMNNITNLYTGETKTINYTYDNYGYTALIFGETTDYFGSDDPVDIIIIEWYRT